eukprot:s197_g6.t1
MIGAYKGNARWIGAMKDVAVYAETLSTALIGRLAGELAVPKAMVWYSFQDGWNEKSYVEAVSFCAKKHMKLAHFEDYCVLKDGNFSMNPKAAPGDQWAPFGGAEENSWVQIGNGHSTMKPVATCKTYLEAFGQKATWGMDGKAYRYKSFLACKAPYGFIMHPSDKGLGTCTGDSLGTQDQAKSQASCRMNCIKLSQCKFASWTEKANGDATCSLFSSCALRVLSSVARVQEEEDDRFDFPKGTLSMTFWEQGADGRKVVIDAGAAIRLKRLERFGGELLTTSGVYAEVRDENAKAMLKTLPVELKVQEPRPEWWADLGISLSYLVLVVRRVPVAGPWRMSRGGQFSRSDAGMKPKAVGLVGDGTNGSQVRIHKAVLSATAIS